MRSCTLDIICLAVNHVPRSSCGLYLTTSLPLSSSLSISLPLELRLSAHRFIPPKPKTTVNEANSEASCASGPQGGAPYAKSQPQEAAQVDCDANGDCDCDADVGVKCEVQSKCSGPGRCQSCLITRF